MKNLARALILVLAIASAPSWADVSMGGPAITYGQNLDKNNQLFAGGWGLFLGSELRFGLAAYSLLSNYSLSANTHSDFEMLYGGALVMWCLNPSLTTPVEFNVGALLGGGHASLSTSSKWFWGAEPTILALFRMSPWFALGIDGRYRYVPSIVVGGHTFDNLRGFSGGLSLVFGSGDGKK